MDPDVPVISRRYTSIATADEERPMKRMRHLAEEDGHGREEVADPGLVARYRGPELGGDYHVRPDLGMHWKANGEVHSQQEAISRDAAIGSVGGEGGYASLASPVDGRLDSGRTDISDVGGRPESGHVETSASSASTLNMKLGAEGAIKMESISPGRCRNGNSYASESDVGQPGTKVENVRTLHTAASGVSGSTPPSSLGGCSGSHSASLPSGGTSGGPMLDGRTGVTTGRPPVLAESPPIDRLGRDSAPMGALGTLRGGGPESASAVITGLFPRSFSLSSHSAGSRAGDVYHDGTHSLHSATRLHADGSLHSGSLGAVEPEIPSVAAPGIESVQHVGARDSGHDSLHHHPHHHHTHHHVDNSIHHVASDSTLASTPSPASSGSRASGIDHVGAASAFDQVGRGRMSLHQTMCVDPNGNATSLADHSSVVASAGHVGHVVSSGGAGGVARDGEGVMLRSSDTMSSASSQDIRGISVHGGRKKRKTKKDPLAAVAVYGAEEAVGLDKSALVDVDTEDGFHGEDGVYYRRPEVDETTLSLLCDVTEMNQTERYSRLMVDYADGVSFPLGEGGRELLRACLNTKGCKGRQLQGASVPQLLYLAREWGLWNVAVRIKVERATGELCSKHQAFVQFKAMQSQFRKYFKREPMSTERDTNGKIVNIEFDQDKYLTLGKDGREKLRALLRRMHDSDCQRMVRESWELLSLLWPSLISS
eukprot:GHVU01117854.1.p1 GENE.GHVU01117854.1~~GHVU01117854.1.p1  ORF type:complete len:711 (+),score=53.28 GHVU01117854.1:1820-3952(+)